MKRILIIIINITLISLIIFIADDIVAKKYLNKCETGSCYSLQKKYLIKNFKVHEISLENIGRKMPKIEGVDYTKPPITVFGCSFAYGQFIKTEDTFEYKLSKLLKVPVINRALPAGSFQHMYYQSTLKDFYKLIPKCNNVIYILIEDHARRCLVDFFDINSDYYMLHYAIRNNRFVMNNYNNRFLNLIRSLYITRVINHKYAQIVLHNEKFKQIPINLTVKYLIESRKNLEKHWGTKIKFTVILYDNITLTYSEEIKRELEKNGFNVIETTNLTDVNLEVPPYARPEDYHPTGVAWDLLTPLIAERLPK